MKFQRYLNLFSTAIFMSSFALVSNAHDNEHALEQEHMPKPSPPNTIAGLKKK